MADRLAGYLVYFALGAAVLTFLITHNIRSTISVVIVAGACGIAAGTPLAILCAIGRAARQGAIIKGGIYLEALGNLDTVFFDKTGTLTLGAPAVKDVHLAHGDNVEALVAAAASAERGSEHPLGKAIVRYAYEHGIVTEEPNAFRYEIGRGISALVAGEPVIAGNRGFLEASGIVVPHYRETSGTRVHVARGGKYAGFISIDDKIRVGSAAAVRAPEGMKIRVILLTGDTSAAALAVANELGIFRFRAGLLPEAKTAEITERTRRGEVVAMLGDGINDAPALSEATVGVAIGAGTDVARESADVVLIGNDLMKFVETVRIARNCRRVILQNFYGTLIVDMIGIGLAAAGFLNPLLAAFIHVASELTFILNSTRLLPSRRKNATINPEVALTAGQA